MCGSLVTTATPRHVGFSSHMGGRGPVLYGWLFEAKFETHATCELPPLLLLLTAHPFQWHPRQVEGFWGRGGGVSTASGAIQ